MPQTLTHSPADVLRWLLIAKGVGSDPTIQPLGNWPIYAADEPDGIGVPDNVITVYDTDGTDEGRIMIDGEPQGHNGFQVRVRASDHKTGYAKIDEVWTVLGKEIYDDAVILDGIVYLVHSANKIGDPIPLGKEVGETKRRLFVLNAVLSLKTI